jgi:sugar phosphate isomerase/epimerase
MKTILLAILLSATTVFAGSNPFFVFDNGLTGKDLKTIGAQLDLVKEVGFDGLSWRSDTPEHLKELLDGSKQRGLKVFVVYVNLDIKDGKLVSDPHVKDVIAACRDTDTMLWPNITSKQFKNSEPAADDIVVAGLRELADSGVRIAVYPHVGMWCYRVEDALRLVKKVNHKNVGLTFNLCHALMDGKEDRIPALLEEVAPHLFCVTINGADSHPKKPAWPQLIQPLGKGSYDVGIVLRKLDALGYKGPVGLQCFNVKGEPKTHLPGSVVAWHKLTNQVSQP